MSNSKVKPYVLYNKPPNTKLLSSHSDMPSCTIANNFIPNPQNFSRPNPEAGAPQEQEQYTEKLGHWRYRHLYPFGYGYGRWGYPYRRYGYGCYGGYGGYGGCYRGGIYGYPWY